MKTKVLTNRHVIQLDDSLQSYVKLTQRNIRIRFSSAMNMLVGEDSVEGGKVSSMLAGRFCFCCCGGHSLLITATSSARKELIMALAT
jgi:hypothetical protein